MYRVGPKISNLIRAAGHIEEARVLLENVEDQIFYQDLLESIADDLAGAAVAERKRNANKRVHN